MVIAPEVPPPSEAASETPPAPVNVTGPPAVVVAPPMVSGAPLVVVNMMKPVALPVVVAVNAPGTSSEMAMSPVLARLVPVVVASTVDALTWIGNKPGSATRPPTPMPPETATTLALPSPVVSSASAVRTTVP